MRILLLAVCLGAALAAHAQSLAVVGGAMQSRVPEAHSFALGVVYTHELMPHLDASLAYRNEGHVPGHHRDGHAAQLWLKANAFVPELTLAAGAGMYRYFDTAVAEGGLEFNDAHGWGAIVGVTATWQPRASRWFYQLRAEHVDTSRNLDVTLLAAGVGYRLDQDPTFGAPSRGGARFARGDEIFVAGGQTIVNSFESQSAGAGAGEYRHAFGRVLHGSIGWLHEGDARLIRRDGVIVQGWLEPSFAGGRYTLGLGYGGYFAVDRYRPGSKDLLALITTTASWRLADEWVGRFSWHRVASRHDRDSDILLLGIGYRF